MPYYEIHDNYNTPFIVRAEDGLLEVIQDTVKLSVNYSKIWIPSDPLGHVILAQINNGYLFISGEIFMFLSISPIVEFHSKIGNNDVPYPYAVDDAGRRYMLIENVIVTHVLQPYIHMSAYDYYYRASVMSPDIWNNPPQNPLINFRNIDKFLIGVDRCRMTYHVNPHERYKHLSEDGDIFVITKNKITLRLTESDYADIMDSFGREMGFQPLVKTIICKRDSKEFSVSEL